MRRDIEVRRAESGDAPAIAAVHLDSIRVLAAPYYGRDQIDAWLLGKEPERYRRAMESGEAMFVADLPEGGLAGFGSYCGDEVRAVYVAPLHARQGVGSRILVGIEQDARRHGIASLWLDASLAAVAFYAARGYARGEEGTHVLRAGVDLECLRMTKRIG
ncbi:MAG: GNAT family N-acetyltransferase [Planctomycetota bacterium]